MFSIHHNHLVMIKLIVNRLLGDINHSIARLIRLFSFWTIRYTTWVARTVIYECFIHAKILVLYLIRLAFIFSVGNKLGLLNILIIRILKNLGWLILRTCLLHLIELNFSYCVFIVLTLFFDNASDFQ